MTTNEFEETFESLAEAEAAEAEEEQTIEIAIVAGSAGEASAIVEPDLPDEALVLLFELDPEAMQASPLRYDREHRRWRPPSPAPEDAAGDSG